MARIVCGIDGSDRSRMALSHATAFARRYGHDVVALHVIDPTADETMSPGQGRIRAARRSAEFEKAQASVLKAHDARLKTVFTERGESTAEALRRAAAEEGAAMLALGSRGGSGIQRKILGGVALGLLGESSLPLLLTGTSAEEPAPAAGPQLWLSDDAIGSAALARALHSSLAGTKSEILVMHAQLPDSAQPLAAMKFEARIVALRRLIPEGCTVEGRFERVRDTAAVLPLVLAAATGVGAVAFALATSGHHLKRRLWGASTALRLLEQSPIPLIVVPRR